jgi:hypothetical protein
VPASKSDEGSGVVGVLVLKLTTISATAKSGATVVNTMLLNAPEKLRVPSGKLRPDGMVPVALVEPTGVVPLRSSRSRVVVVLFVLRANSIETLLTMQLKATSRRMLSCLDGPGSKRTLLEKLKNVGTTTNPPGSAGELKLAVTPLLVIENGVAVTVPGGEFGKSNVAISALIWPELVASRAITARAIMMRRMRSPVLSGSRT